jgi:succinate dehydrogenase / fumarate reductase, cytochrome b subunit
MSTVALDVTLRRPFAFYEAYIGKKVVMAATGVILFGYVIGHLLGNLQIYMGAAQMNRYAQFLHSQGALLWVVRSLLIACVGLHIVSSFQLWLQKRRARPVAYVKKDDIPASYASRTMIWSGPIIAAFVVFHVLHLTTGSVGLNYRAPREIAAGGEQFFAYQNVISGFQHPAVAIAYIFAIALLTMHLYHGIWSMFQSVGASHPRYTPLLKKAAHAIAIAVAAGYISIPVSVQLGLVG